MIGHLLTATRSSFLLLRRDKVFLPALIAGFFVVILANLASDWSVEDFEKILFDVGTFGFHITGSLVALFWGTKAVVDSRKEGTLEIDLAAPISRSVWLVGKFLGLLFSLVLLGVILLIVWQLLMFLNLFGWLTWQQFMVFLFLVLGWLVLSSIATFFATFCGSAVALFSGLCFWLVGLSSSAVKQVLSPETPDVTKWMVIFLSRVWDLQQFNLSDFAASPSFPPTAELWWRGVYGVMLILILLTTSCIIFERRDVTN